MDEQRVREIVREELVAWEKRQAAEVTTALQAYSTETDLLAKKVTQHIANALAVSSNSEKHDIYGPRPFRVIQDESDRIFQ